MAGKKRSRRRLDDRVEEVLAVDQGRGPEEGLADVATRRDAEALAGAARRDRSAELDRRLERRFDHIDDLFDRQTAEITAAMTLQTRQTIFAILGVLLAVAALVAAVIGLG